MTEGLALSLSLLLQSSDMDPKLKWTVLPCVCMCVCVCVCACVVFSHPISWMLLCSKQNKSASHWRLVQGALAHSPFSLLPFWVAPAQVYLGLRCTIFSWSQTVWPQEMVQGILQGNKRMELSWLFKIHMSRGPPLWWSQGWDMCLQDWGLWMFEGKFCHLERVSFAPFPCRFPQVGSGQANWSTPCTASPT